MTKNRSKLARERAGLSVGQACKLLTISREDLIAIEERDSAFEDGDVDLRSLMADIYAVDPAWLAGTAPRRDYASVDKMRGADKLTFHDRDVIAEFAASMPRRRRT